MEKFNYIKEKLIDILAKVTIDNDIGLYDINKQSENIFMHTLNDTYGWNLKNANLIKENFLAIDLIDDTHEILVQVTSATDTSKVRNTIKKLKELADYRDYELKIFYIKNKPKFKREILKEFAKEGLLSEDLLGIKDILKSIEENLETCNRVYTTFKKLFDSDIYQTTLEMNIEDGFTGVGNINGGTVHQTITKNYYSNNPKLLEEQIKKELKKFQRDSTHALREDEFVPTLGKHQEEIKFFISYSQKDKDDVGLLVSELEKTPYPFVFWKYDRNLMNGESFSGDIQEAIEDCDFGLLMVSENFENEFIIEYELPHFLEMSSSEISKTKASIPLFINYKNNVIEKLNYINNKTFIFSHDNGGFIESRDRKAFIEGLISEIFKQVEKQQLKEKQVIGNLQNIDEVKEVEESFIPTKAEFGIDIVQEIKEWSNILVDETVSQCLKLEENIDKLEQKIKNENTQLERVVSRIKLREEQEKNRQSKIREDVEKNKKNLKRDKKSNIRKYELTKKDKQKKETEDKFDKVAKQVCVDNIEILGKEKASYIFKLKRFNNRKNNSKYFALLGDSGMGKTWSCMKIALELQKEDTILNPIYLDLRHFASSEAINREFDWQEIIEIVVRKSLSQFKKDMSITTIFDIIKRGEAFIIFDGLDEVTVHLDDDRRVNAFIKELKNVVLLNQRNKVLFSCRTHYFRTIQEQFSMLSGQDRERIQNKDFMSLELLPFSWSQIEEYCVKNDIDFLIFKEIVTTIHNLEEVSQRPYSLKLITLQIRELEEAIKDGREVNSADIYLGIIESSLNRDSGKHTLSKVHKPLIMQELSAYMWSKGARVLEYPKLDAWFTKWMYEHPDIADEYKNESREKLKSDLRGATFMVRPNANVFRFSHTSLQEFFLAQYLFKAFENSEFNKFKMNLPSVETIEFFVMIWKRDLNKIVLMENFNELILENPYFAFEIYLVAYRLELEINREEAFLLENLDFSAREFYGLEKNFINLKNSKFININFDKTQLEHIDFGGSRFENSRFLNSKWINSDFSNVTFYKCIIKLSHYDLLDVDVKNVTYIESSLL